MKPDPDNAPTVDERPSSKPRAPEEPLAPPFGHARYEAGEEIARGGMGRVVEATDTLLGRTVALKEALGANDDTLRRFRREIYITARLEHPSIVPVHDAGTRPDGSPFYVMRKVSGRPLTELIGAATTLEARLALLPHVVAAAQAIAHAHRRGVIHRDVKPANILVGELGETVVIDWGLAKVIGEPDDQAQPAVDAGSSLRTRFGTVFGTPGFMAPEQARGEQVGTRSDVYALGATLYYTFTRQPPHASADEDEMMAAAASGPPQPIGEVVDGLPRELSTIVDKALAYEELDRYADAGELAEDLQRFVSGQLVASHRYSSRERLARFVRNNRLAVAIATIAIATVVIGGSLAVLGIIHERDRADIQAQLAISREHDTELAREQEQQRGDQLLLMQARSLAVMDPTAAVALVKQLEHPAERWDRLWRQARAVAATADYNGVAHALAAPESASQCILSPKGRRAASLSRDGEVTTYDLDTLTVTKPQQLAHMFGFAFSGEDQLLVYSAHQLVVIDLETQTQRIGALAAVPRLVLASNHAYWIVDTEFHLERVDPKTLVATPFSSIAHIDFVSVSNDGNWLVVTGPNDVVLVDLEHGETVKVIDHGAAHAIRWDRDSTRLALSYRDSAAVFALDHLGAPVRRQFANEIVYVTEVTSRETYFNTTSGLYVTQGAGLLPLSRQGGNDSGAAIAQMGSTLIIARGDHIDVLDREHHYSLVSPAGAVSVIASSSFGQRVIALTPGHLLVWDLARHDPLSAEFRGVTEFILAGKHVALIHRLTAGWEWLDLDKQRGTTLSKLDAPILSFTSGTSGAIVAAMPGTTNDDNVFFIRDGTVNHLHVPDVLLMAPLADGRLALASKSGALDIYDGDKKSTLVSHPATPLDFSNVPGWLAIVYDDGTVLRLELATGKVDTLHVAVRPRMLTISAEGTLLIATGRMMMRWQRDGLLLLHAVLPLEIVAMVSLAHHASVRTSDGGTYTVTYDAPAQVNTLPPGFLGWFSYSAELGVFGSSDGLTMIDAYNGMTWPLPTAHYGFSPRMVAPGITDDARYVGAMIDDNLYVWNPGIPLDRDAVARQLDQLTNATAELGTATLTFH